MLQAKTVEEGECSANGDRGPGSLTRYHCAPPLSVLRVEQILHFLPFSRYEYDYRYLVRHLMWSTCWEARLEVWFSTVSHAAEAHTGCCFRMILFLPFMCFVSYLVPGMYGPGEWEKQTYIHSAVSYYPGTGIFYQSTSIGSMLGALNVPLGMRVALIGCSQLFRQRRIGDAYDYDRKERRLETIDSTGHSSWWDFPWTWVGTSFEYLW